MLGAYQHIIWVHNTLLLDNLSTLPSNFFFSKTTLCQALCWARAIWRQIFFGFCLGETHHLVGERNKEVDIYKVKQKCNSRGILQVIWEFMAKTYGWSVNTGWIGLILFGREFLGEALQRSWLLILLINKGIEANFLLWRTM